MTFKSLQYFNDFCRNFRIFFYKYYQDKQEKEDYYNNVYTYSGDYEIGDYEFLGDKGIVAKWVSKDPEEDKQIRKHLKNDPQSKVEYHNNDVIMAGKRFIIRENFKTMSRKRVEVPIVY